MLDVGSGLGDLAAAAAARGARVTGCDLAEGMVAAARERHPGIEFVQGDVEALPFADGEFDAVLAAFVVNHVPDPERAAAELTRVSRGRVALAMWGPPDEVALLGLPARAVVAAGLGDAAVPEGPSSDRFTDAGELTRLLAGLDVELREVRFALPVAGLDELWDGVLGGTVRTAARLAAATPAAARACPRGARAPGRAVPRRRRLRAPDDDPRRRRPPLTTACCPRSGRAAPRWRCRPGRGRPRAAARPWTTSSLTAW